VPPDHDDANRATAFSPTRDPNLEALESAVCEDSRCALQAMMNVRMAAPLDATLGANSRPAHIATIARETGTRRKAPAPAMAALK
jgi:hypothetical protein